MISYNQHRKKWQRGCPCNLLINIFDKVSYYLITPHGKYEVKQRKFVKEEKKVKEEKRSVNEKNLKRRVKNLTSLKKFFGLFFIYPTTIWRGKQWSKRKSVNEKRSVNRKINCENKKVICEKPTGSKTLTSLKKKFFGFFFLSFHFFLDEKTQCWRPRRPHTI